MTVPHIRIIACEECISHGTSCEIVTEDDDETPRHCPMDRIPKWRVRS